MNLMYITNGSLDSNVQSILLLLFGSTQLTTLQFYRFSFAKVLPGEVIIYYLKKDIKEVHISIIDFNWSRSYFCGNSFLQYIAYVSFESLLHIQEVLSISWT